MSKAIAPLSALIVEDSASDAGLMVRQLERLGYKVRYERVDNAVAMRAALATLAWEVVLSDYNVPGFGAMEALAVLRESGLEIPFIVVSGTINEADAVELMRAGAHDYLMKDNLNRLAPAIERELADAKTRLDRRQAQAALRDSEARFRAIADSASDAILTVDATNRIRFFSRGAETMFGYSLAEILGQPTTRIIPEALRSEHNAGIARYLATRQARIMGKVVEQSARRKSGEVFPIELSLSESTVSGEWLVTAIVRDISERKLAENRIRESERRFRLLIEGSLTGMYMIQQGCIIYANPRLEQILGYGPGELVGVRPDALVIAEDSAKIEGSWQELLAGARVSSYTARIRRKDGGVIDLGIQAVMTDLEGVQTVIGMAQDIGERIRAQAEIAHYVARLEHSTEATLQAVALIVEQRDPYTAGHERRVGDLAAAIGTEMSLSEAEVKGLRLSGYVHDVGKISVPSELLTKPTRLTPIEFDLIKLHPQTGYDMLKNIDFPWPVAEVILQHHERLDGSGYPNGLKGEAIRIEARIMAVADVIEAMASHRPYRPGLGLDKALDEIERGKGSAYDPAIVDACVTLFQMKHYHLPT